MTLSASTTAASLHEFGTGDQDGLEEQEPFRDWQNAGMV